MKYGLISFIFLLLSVFARAQDSSHLVNDQRYMEMRDFLQAFKKDSSVVFHTNFQPAEYQKQYQALLKLDKEKTFYPVLLYDTRFVSHALPAKAGSQPYIWVDNSSNYKNFKEQLISEISSSVINGVFGGKKRAVSNGYYTPAGLQY